MQTGTLSEQVSSPEPENQQEPADSGETTPPSLPPQVSPRSLPPQTSAPSLPEMDFFHSDPFTDRESHTGDELPPTVLKEAWSRDVRGLVLFAEDPFKDDPFGKADVAGDVFVVQNNSSMFLIPRNEC